jgi:hypothetical protein
MLFTACLICVVRLKMYVVQLEYCFHLCARNGDLWGCLQVMTTGQRVPFEFYGTNYIFTVNQALLEGQESSTPLDRGFLSSDTYIIFEAAPNSGIKVLLCSYQLFY